MLGHLSLRRVLLEIALFLLPALFFALIFGHLLLFLLLSTLLLIGWNYYQMRRLSHWLWNEHHFYPPEGRGSWLPIFHGLHRMRLEQRKERNRLLDFIRYFRKGAASMPDAIILCDAEGRLNWCNPQAEAMLHFRWPQDEGQSIFNLIRQPEFLEHFRTQQFATPFLLTDEKRELECRFYYPYIENNLLIIARDITDREIAERTRQTFFANVNHELRVPLTVIKGYLEMLEGNLPENEESFEARAFARMGEQVDRLHSLVIQLMTLTRLETNPQTEEFKEVDLSEIAKKIAANIEEKPLAEREGIQFEIEPHLQTHGNRDQLEQVMSNLFYNALEHNPPKTPIKLSLKRDRDGKIRFAVKDSGKGIAPVHLHKLTERFYRVDSSRNREESGGSGLGLAIVKHALNNHHSKLEIESELGKGSIFSFTLPALPSSSATE